MTQLRSEGGSGNGMDAVPESRLAHGLAYVLIAVAPLTVFEELGLPITHGVLPLYVTPVVELSDVPALGLLLVAAWRCWREQHAGKAQRRIFSLRLTGPLLILASLGLISSPWALSPPLAYYSTIRWLLAAGVAWALVRVGPSPRCLATALLLALVPQALIGIGQAISQGPLGLPWELPLPRTNPGAPIIGLMHGPWLRAYGLTFHPNVLGGFLAVGLVVSVPLLVRPWAHPLWWILWGGLLVTFSRSAWLAVSLMMPVVLTWLYLRSPALRRPILRAALGYGVMLVAAGCLLANQIATRLEPLLSAATARIDVGMGELAAAEWGRLEMAEVALRTVAAHPLVGIGPGTFPLSMLIAHTRSAPQYVHNVPLLLASEVGIAGGVLWLSIWFAAAGILIMRWRRLSAWAVAALAAGGAIAVISLFDSYPWSLQSGRLLTAIVLALADRALAEKQSNAWEQRPDDD